LQESGFPLEARVGIEAVRRFKQSTNSLREKPEVKSWKCKASGAMRSQKWRLLAPHFAGRRMSGNGNFPARSAVTQPHTSHSQFSSHSYSRLRFRLPFCKLFDICGATVPSHTREVEVSLILCHRVWPGGMTSCFKGKWCIA
jgi:hypothetical protein